MERLTGILMCIFFLPEDIAATESCVLHLRREDWDVSTQTASVTTRIVATRDVIRDGDQSLAVRFRPLFSLAPPLWHNYSPPEIQVRNHPPFRTGQDDRCVRC